MIKYYLLFNEYVRKKPAVSLPALFVLILLSRFPFLFSGFGLDPDAWRIVNSARNIWLNGDYIPSRFPGYPVLEFTYSLLTGLSPLYFNLLTAIISTSGLIFFYMVLSKLNCKDGTLTVLGLAFLPVIYVNSISTMDYLWAFTFITLSVYLLLIKNYFASAVILGLAAGARVTYILFLVPIMLFFFHKRDENFIKSAGFVFVSLLTGLICFIPLFLKYKFSFLTFYDYHEYPSPVLILFKLYLAFGIIGGLALIFAVFTWIRRKYFKKSGSASISFLKGDLKLFFISIIIIYLVLFFRLPLESGYLVPLLPFALILAAAELKRKIFLILMLLFIFSPFLFSHSHGIYGLIFRENILREEMISDAKWLIERAEKMKNDSVIIIGPLLPIVEYYLDGKTDKFKYTLEKDEADSLKALSFQIFYSEMGNKMNIESTGVDLFYYGKKLNPPH